MNPSHAKSSSPVRLVRSAPLALLSLLIGSASFTFAQSVVAPEVNTSALHSPPPSTSGETVSSGSAATAPASQLIWGPAVLHPQISYRYLSTDGLLSQPGQKHRTDIQSFSPGLAAEIGRHISMRYVYTWNLYSSSAFRDTSDQAGGVSWNTQYEEWKLSASHDFSRTDEPMVETGSQTRQTTHASGLNVLYGLNSRYALETTLGQNLRFTDRYSDTYEWTIREMVHQQTTPQLDSAVGVEYSYTAIEKTADMAALRLLASLTWHPVKQLNAALQAGLEKRRIYTTPSASVTNPVYSASLGFFPKETTRLNVSVSRSSSASFFESLLSETTQYGVNFQQTFLKHVQFTTSYNHQDTTYKSALQALNTTRKDKTDTVNLGLGTTFFTKFRGSITYQYANNSSNVAGFKFSSEQYGGEIGYSF